MSWLTTGCSDIIVITTITTRCLFKSGVKNHQHRQNQHTWKEKKPPTNCKKKKLYISRPTTSKTSAHLVAISARWRSTNNKCASNIISHYSFVLGGDHRQLRGGVRVPAGQRGAHRGLPRVQGGHRLAQVDIEQKAVHENPLITARMQEFLVKLAKAKDARQAVHDYYDQLWRSLAHNSNTFRPDVNSCPQQQWKHTDCFYHNYLR